MDHIIREAAENHHPPYNDKAWDKMEQKLDKHLPQKKDNRRLIFFFLFSLLLGGGILFFINIRYANSSVVTAEKNDKTTNTDKTDVVMNGPVQKSQISEKQVPVLLPTQDNDSPSLNTGAKKGKATEINNGKPLLPNNQKSSGYKTATQMPVDNNASITDTKNKARKDDFVKVFKADDDKKYKLNEQNKNEGGNKYRSKTGNIFSKALNETHAGDALTSSKKPISGKTGSKLKVNVTSPGTENEDPATNSTSNAVTEKKDAEPSSKINTETTKEPLKPETDKKLTASNKNEKKKSQKNKFSSNFGLTFSVGPDMGFVKLNRTGKTTITYGLGLSYNFAKRLTARVGFYVSRKKYQASPDEYHNTIYPNLTSIDANCKVYEIPLSLTYNFARRKKHNWFGNIGISSFIMKKEDYVYNYKTPAGQTYTYNHSISNENKHLFSVLDLSAGYKYQLSQNISLQAEPYVQIPLGGVGLGKIKLNSAGVLFTATYKPFKKKK